MQLAAVTLTKAQLDLIPSEERLFYLMAGQLLNDINILSKLLAAAINELNFVDQDPPKRSAAIAQVLLMLKMTARRLYEGYDMIGDNCSEKGFLRKYRSGMSDVTLAGLVAMNKYFAGGSAVQWIRSKLGSPLDAEAVANAYANAPADFTSVEYLSDQFSSHSLFRTSETLSLMALTDGDLEKWRETIHQLGEELTAAGATIGVFLVGFIRVIFSRYLGRTMQRQKVANVTVMDDPPIDAMRLPFFFELPDPRA